MQNSIELEFLDTVPDNVIHQFLASVHFSVASDCVNTPCLVWTKTLINGYGWVLRGTHLHNFTQEEGSHRAAYLICVGYFSPELLVLHKCDIKACCNPVHLYIGTKSDNAKDAYARDRMNLPVGEEYSYSKISNDNVVEMRRLHKTGKYNCTLLAQMFNVSRSHAWRVVNKQRRKKG